MDGVKLVDFLDRMFTKKLYRRRLPVVFFCNKTTKIKGP